MLSFVMITAFRENLGDAPCSASSQARGFCSDTAASPVSVPSARSTELGPAFLAKTTSAEQCKMEPEWVVAGKPPRLYNNQQCAPVPHVRVGAGRNPLIFLLHHPRGSCHPISREARRVGSLLSRLRGIQTGAPWKPPECARHRNRNKTFSSPETKSGPFYDGHGRPLVRDAGRLLAQSLARRGPGPQPKDGRRGEESESETYSDTSLPALRWHHRDADTQVSELEHPRILSNTWLLSCLGKK